MLPTTLVMEIRRLLDRGELSQRAIARKVGVSRGVIADMASGRRGDHGRDPDERPPNSSPKRELTIPIRCPACGGLVYAPCRLCRARRINAEMLAARRQLNRREPGPRRAA